MVNNTALDLQVINETFGENADLYEDVLRVPTTATQEEIQLAYFDRRSELFTLLAKIDAAMKDPQSESSSSMMIDQRRYKAERQMDSVVFAVRILADPTLRILYDEIRPERVGIIQLGYPLKLKQTQSAVPTESSSVVSRTSSALSSTMNNDDDNNNYRSQPKHQQQYKQQYHQREHHQREQSPPQQNQQEWPSRVVTPTELPANSSTVSESKSWVKSAYGSLLSFGNNSRTEYGDNIDDDNDDDDNDNDTEIEREREDFEENIDIYNNNPRKQKRRQKQQQPSPSTSPTCPAEYHLRENPARVEKERKSLWGRKKRKKKKQSKHQNGVPSNQIIDSNVTDKSMTDNKKDSHDNHKVGDRDSSARTRTTSKREGRGVSNDLKKIMSIQSEHTTGTGEESERDDDTRTFLDDDGDTFATLSVFSNDDDEKLQKKANTCGKQGMFGCITGSKTFQKLSDEISGACEDTLISVDQVFNAFTLTDKDIKAVTKKIGKAKRQLET
mmetsp:Transcript_27570/g.30927  ORF Transcript_27570/g.30927 Transcript_27570/m.30927 type:complete len:500 (+) Transcript_27570:196-1695(+)